MVPFNPFEDKLLFIENKNKIIVRNQMLSNNSIKVVP